MAGPFEGFEAEKGNLSSDRNVKVGVLSSDITTIAYWNTIVNWTELR